MTKLEMRQHYRSTFFTPSGREVLKDLLIKNYFFNDNLTVEMSEIVGKQNAVKAIVNMLSCADMPELTVEAIIDGMEKVPLIVKPEEEETD